MNIAVIVGSLRGGSFNRSIFDTFLEVAPEGVTVTEAGIGELPLFNQDKEDPLPSPVSVFKTNLEEADGIILITPEYNRSIPGVLKNAIDWASRGKKSSWRGKKTAILGATNGSLGTAPAQQHLRSVLVHLGTLLMGQPEMNIGHVKDKLGSDGVMVDQETRDRLETFLRKFIDHIKSCDSN